jgi:hypothetical protein
MVFGKKKQPAGHMERKEPHTQLITGVHAAHTSWRLLRWLLFLAALLSVVCGGFLLTVKFAEARCEYQQMQIDGKQPTDSKFDVEQAKTFVAQIASAFRKYWVLFVLILAAVFTFFELFIHSRWKIYAIYALIAVAAWVFVLYSFNLMDLPLNELPKAGGGG